MNHVTSIGLDVHALFITTFALDSLTGEVRSKKFGYDPAEVASWILQFDFPKAVYESGVTGFHLVRALREMGMFSRFDTARSFASWLGLVPSEYSSGEHISRGAITKAGNSHLRKLLVEASWHYTYATKERKRSLYDKAVPFAISNHAATGVKRLVERRRHFSCDLRKRPVVANVATARELACWDQKSGEGIWPSPEIDGAWLTFALDNILLILAKRDAFRHPLKVWWSIGGSNP